MSSGSVVIIGGGVIGTACAHFLSRAGWNVTITDKATHGDACSRGNCGFVCPSHVLPLAEPGAIGRTLWAMTAADSPFYVKPRIDFRFLAWMANFARRCNLDDMIAAGHGIQALLDSSMILYERLVHQEGLECEWEKRGLLFAYADKSQLDAYDATNRLLSEEFHHAATKMVGDELQQFEPALKPGLAGGWYYADDAHLRPDKLMRTWRQKLEGAGVKIVERCEFQSFRCEAGKAVAAITSGGEFAADEFIVATGAWTPLLNNHVGCAIPIEPGKGYSLTMPRPSRCPKVPMIFPETRVAVTPMQSAYRLGSTMEFAGYDSSINPERLGLLRKGARPYLIEPECDPVSETWYGWRPMTYDSLPIIDRSPLLRNVLVAAGHSMLGLSMAPSTGQLAAEILSGEQPHLDVTPYSLARFRGI